LPQLWNVVCGEMSLVGPRPVVAELVVEFHQAYTRLLEVRPGLTDPATMKYCREDRLLVLVADPLSYFKTVLTPDKLRLSAAYLDRATVWSDLGILAGTFFALIPAIRRPRLVRAWSSEPGNAGALKFSDPVNSAEPLPFIESI
jgi:lipopolysaccharide/colanic/teichoic acid biosynthesis glycosyltransferase